MGLLVEKAMQLPQIKDSDAWEQAVEALLLAMAAEVEGGVLRQADYTRKTQELSALRRSLQAD